MLNLVQHPFGNGEILKVGAWILKQVQDDEECFVLFGVMG